jgi:hypothetical protein
MPFPIVAVAFGAVAAAATPYLLYGSVAYLPDTPSGMDAATLKLTEDALLVVHQGLVKRGWDFSITTHVPAGKSCVEASESRCRFIAGLLSDKWEVFSCTVSAGTHTFNVVKYQNHHWIVDSYLIVYVKYIGSSIPSGMAITPGNSIWRGSASSI